MALISLTQGFEAIVDDEDYDFLMQWKWHICRGSHIYAMRNSAPINGKRTHILMHRVLCKTPDGFDTDHINGNGLDNRRSNLRAVSRSQNMWNRLPNKNGGSLHKGVHWHKQHSKWVASIQINRKRRHIGLFENEHDAAAAYTAAAERHFGEYSHTKGVSA